MVASLLYYLKFCKTLKLNKFKMNPYYPCVANRLVNGQQQYIIFHVDYCKLSHKYPKVNDSFIGVIRKGISDYFEDESGTMQVKCVKVRHWTIPQLVK